MEEHCNANEIMKVVTQVISKLKHGKPMPVKWNKSSERNFMNY